MPRGAALIGAEEEGGATAKRRTRTLSRVRNAFATEIARSITGSLGRFLAIMGIVALGCGFYAGLQMCGPDMRAAADALYDGTNLYDIRLVSTLGFTRADAERVRNIAGVRSAMPAVSVDAMARLSDEQLAVRISSIDVDAARSSDEQGANVILSDDGSYLNRVFLRKGRWPSAADECVITADKPVGDLGIGDTIQLAYGTVDLDEVLQERTLRIVGTVSSSNYPYTGSFGSTTLGSGMIGEYLYVSQDAFVEDAPFTEMYLTVEGAEELESGSDAYQEVIDEVLGRIEEREDELAQARLDDVRTAAQEQLDENRAEYEQQREDAYRELDAAKEKLDAAAEELADGERQYAEGVETLDASRAQLEAGQAELDAGEDRVSSGTQELLAQLRSQGIEANSLSEARSKLEAARDQVSEGIGSVVALESAGKYVDQLKETVTRYEQFIDELSGAPIGTSVEEARAYLEASLAEANAVAARLDELAAVEGADEGIIEAAAWAHQQVNELETRLAQINAYFEMLEQAEADLAMAQAELAELEAQMADAPSREELEATRSQIAEGLSAVAQLEAAEHEIEANRTVIASGWRQLSEGQEELAEAYAKLEAGREEYATGLASYESAKAEADEGFSKAEEQLADAQKRIDEIELPDLYVLDRTKSEGAATYHADTMRMDSIAAVFPFIFFLVAALVSLTTMTRMVEDDRIIIGTHKALGYDTAHIAAKYLIYAGIAATTGAVVGIAALSQVLPYIVTSAYSIIYAIPLHPFPLPISMPIAISSGMLGVGVTLAATWFAVVSSLRETPATLMLPRAPAAGKRILLERIGPIWRHLSFSWKVTCRNLFRYKRRLTMTVIGISGCTALLLVGFGLHDSIWDIIDCQYGPVIHYDTTVSLDADATELDVRNLVAYLESTGEVDGIVRVQQENMQAGLDPDGETIRVAVVIPQDLQGISEAITFRDRRTHTEYEVTGNSVLVTEKLALKYGISGGDTILLFDQDEIGNVRGEGHPLTVSAVVENYVGNLIYVGGDAWASIDADEPAFSTIFARTTQDDDVRSDLANDLHAREDISTVIFSDETINLYRNMLSVVDMIVVVLIVSAGALAFIVLYNLTNINISERVREIASLKVLGFTRGEVYAYIFREIAILAILGDALGMMLGTFLERFVVTTAEVDYVMFGRTIHPASYGYSFALTLLFTVVILLLMRHKLDRVDMVESLKSVD